MFQIVKKLLDYKWKDQHLKATNMAHSYPSHITTLGMELTCFFQMWITCRIHSFLKLWQCDLQGLTCSCFQTLPDQSPYQRRRQEFMFGKFMYALY